MVMNDIIILKEQVKSCKKCVGYGIVVLALYSWQLLKVDTFVEFIINRCIVGAAIDSDFVTHLNKSGREFLNVPFNASPCCRDTFCAKNSDFHSIVRANSRFYVAVTLSPDAYTLHLQARILLVVMPYRLYTCLVPQLV